MKRNYQKPRIELEYFTLSQNIAAGCGAAHDSSLGHPNQWSKETCGWELGNVILWMENSGCTVPLGEDAYVEGVCYNNPEGGQTIFSS